MALVAYTYADRATANSYATVAEFTTYLANRLNAPTIATDAEKELLLIEATRRLEIEKYLGVRTYADGRLKFPRSDLPDYDSFVFDSDLIPELVKFALFETAIYSKSQSLTEANDTINFQSATVGELSVTYKNSQLSPSDTLTSAVWGYLAPFLDYKPFKVTR